MNDTENLKGLLIEDKDGGPAFPWHQSPGNQNNLGMSMLDYFAAKSLSCDWFDKLKIGEYAYDEFVKMLCNRARMNYAMAEAMLIVRKEIIESVRVKQENKNDIDTTSTQPCKTLHRQDPDPSKNS